MSRKYIIAIPLQFYHDVNQGLSAVVAAVVIVVVGFVVGELHDNARCIQYHGIFLCLFGDDRICFRADCRRERKIWEERRSIPSQGIH